MSRPFLIGASAAREWTVEQAMTVAAHGTVDFPVLATPHLIFMLEDTCVLAAEPFLVAAAKAMEIDTLHQIDTGLDPVTAEREQWDDGNNTLAVAPRVAVAYERNVETNARLEEAGIEVIAISGSELGSGRGGPRCMSCPIARDPA